MKRLHEAGLEQHLARFPATPPGPVKARVLQRVQASARDHRDYLTLRREHHRWQPLMPGVREQRLRQAAGLQVALWQLEPGTALQLPDDTAAAELLVVAGGLRRPRPQPDEQDRLGLHRYLTLGPAGTPLDWQATEPTLLYVRRRLSGAAPLPALEEHWWALAAAQAGRSRLRRWSDSAAGVTVMPLCGDARVVSMLVRFEPGGTVADHHHALDEDCLVLAGEMFLGDILLRALDYQLAPAGGGHFGEMSDVGVTFFFHGALDPVLLG